MTFVCYVIKAGFWRYRNDVLFNSEQFQNKGHIKFQI